MYSKAILIGRLGRDPEFKTTSNNKPVCNFSIACDHGYGDTKSTSWFNIISFNEKLNDALIRPYIKKGSRIYIEGELVVRDYEKKDGTKGKAIEVKLNAGSTIKLLNSKENNNIVPESIENSGPPSLDGPPALN
tara:strand:+ start:284 stop:685 length:402 start_codon:yes stop_codon:yes gene_type:complete